MSNLLNNTFKPQQGAMDFSSIISDYMVYGNGKCQEFKPDRFIVLNEGDEDNIKINCSRIYINTKCGNEIILLDKIELREVGNHVAILCCEDAVKHKFSIKCKPTGNCDTTLMRINLKKFFGCDSVPMLINNSLDFRCETSITCKSKVESFVTIANASQSYATFSIDPNDEETIIVEWNEAGVVFSIEALDGFYPEQLIQYGYPAIGKGKDLKAMMMNSNEQCLPDACHKDRCYKLFVYLTNEWVNNAGHGLFSSSTGINNNNSFVMVRKLNWIAVENSADKVMQILIEAFNTAGPYKLICDTDCITQNGAGNNICIRCISRDDDGSPNALTLMQTDYPTALGIELHHYDNTAGVSYYTVAFNCDNIPAVLNGDTMNNTPCNGIKS